MPIFIQNYIWKQTNNTLQIVLPIENAKSSKLDIFSSDNFIKINHPPFIFECFLHKNIINSKTKCIIHEKEIIVELQKAEPGKWNNLHQEVNKTEIVEKIEKTIHKEHENKAIEAKNKTEKKEELKRFLRDKQLSIRIKEDEAFKKFKNDIISKELKEVINWESNILEEKSYNKVAYSSVPFPRRCETISFSFTPRVFPTPKRESKSKEENEWLMKEAEARRCTGFVAEDLSEKEKDPSWLLSKGESFMKCGNYLGAVNVFFYGTQLKPKMPEFHVQLAKAHLKLNNFYKAMESSTQALELLTPTVKQNKKMKSEAYMIRSQCYKNIGEIAYSDQDLKASELL